MSSADDILFSPLSQEPAWRLLTERINEYIAGQTTGLSGRYQGDRKRPDGSLLLLDMMRLFHEQAHKTFYLVYGRVGSSIVTIDFDGVLCFGLYEKQRYPALSRANGRSIRDLNLYPNCYNRSYVFAYKADAENYWERIG